MADHPIGADHLDGMDGMFGGVRGVGSGRRRRGGFGGLARRSLRRRRVLAGKRRNQIAAGEIGAAVALPLRTAAQLGGRKILVPNLREIGLPAFIYRRGVGQPGRVHLLDKGGVGAIEERGRLEDVVGGAIQPI